MRWFNCKKEEFVSLECINAKTDKHILRLSPNGNFISEDGSKNDIRFIPIYVNNKPNVKEIKKLLLSLQEEYDNSVEVNNFYLNGKKAWLDKATRVGLVNSLTMQKNSGLTETTLWLNKTFIDINIDKALTLLAAIELYAMACYNNTHLHYAEISKLTTIDELVAYDITAGYPEQLNIETE